jgi:carbon storage regulator
MKELRQERGDAFNAKRSPESAWRIRLPFSHGPGAEMLILSRYPGESIYIGDDLFVTLTKIGADEIELDLHNSAAIAKSSHRLKVNEKIEISPEIRITFIEVRDSEKGQRARLGIEVPRDVPVYRKEVWDAIHGDHGPS